MPTHAIPYPRGSGLSRWLMVGVISGAASVLVFHQPVVEVFRAFALTHGIPYSLQPTRPFGVPQVWSLAFWGGVWGALLAATLARLDGARLLLASLVFGAVAPTLVAWFLVAPLKGQAVAGGWMAAAMALALLANSAWGLGTGIGLALFGHPGRRANPRAPRERAQR